MSSPEYIPNQYDKETIQKLSSERVMLVGGAGFIGHHLLCSAVKRNWEVTNLSLHKPISKRWISKVRYQHGNLLELDQLKKIAASLRDKLLNN